MFLKILVGVLILLYPAVIYYGITNDMAWFGLSLLIIFLAYQAWSSPHQSWLYLSLVVVLLLGGWFEQGLMVKLVPLFIHISMFVVFWFSLRADSPIIEKFARLDFPELPEDLAEHCRQMTYVWAAFFALNIVVIITLAWWGSDELWLLYNGVLAYVLVGVLIVGEYIWRKLKFPELEMPSFKDTVVKISKNSRDIFRNSR